MKAGEHLVQVAFLDETYAWENQLPERDYNSHYTARIMRNYDYERAWVEPSVSSIVINGPFNVKGPGNTESRGMIFSCMPDNNFSEESCARQILSNLVRKAYRRPVTDSDISPFLNLFRKGRQEGDRFESGIQVALQGLLVSSEFLFRVYREPANPSNNTVYELNDLELASRMS
ncbi:MAG: DUF1595 domain-containing protein, partial [Gammaproteobacteria bacterium]|nr:DUF1595 domain-containing protein [Gammaproteobacteria bacterium]NIO61052.1 DUF1595 domain-containing protein [Gammaproteobacteria bacterium]